MTLEKDLEGMGLSDKEAKVYIAALQLGEAVAQKIADKAGVNRATTYFIMEGLMQRGLMSSFYKGKKRFFVAEHPERLETFLEDEQNRIALHRDKFHHDVLPQLISINNRFGEKPAVKFYEGDEGIVAMADDFFGSIKDGDSVYIIVADRKLQQLLNDEKYTSQLRQKIMPKNLTIYSLYTNDAESYEKTEHKIRKHIPEGLLPIECEITIHQEKVAFVTLSGKRIGVIIEDSTIARSLIAFFAFAWKASKTPSDNPSEDGLSDQN